MKNIAIVTLGYYPDMSPVTAVLDKYIQALKGQYHFHIIALQTRTNFVPINDPNISIYYMNNFWWNLRLKCEETLKMRPNFLAKLAYQFFRLKTFFFGIFEDFEVFKWLRKDSYNQLKALSEKVNIDSVITISGAYLFLHQGAKRFKKEFPDTQWITFVTDPISFSSLQYKIIKVNEKRKFKRLYKQEKEVYDEADYNIFTENLYFDALENFHQPKEKTLQFRFVLENMLSKYKKEGLAHDNSIVKMIYAGALYRQIRNPEYMLSVVSRVPNVCLDMYVRTLQCMDILEKYKSDKIIIHSGVDVQQYKSMICNEYDILINIGNNCENQLPSKTLELLSSGRPIINFYHYKDSQYEMIEKYPLGINIGRDDDKAVKKVDDFCKEMKGKQLLYEEVVNLYPEHSLESQLKILESILNN